MKLLDNIFIFILLCVVLLSSGCLNTYVSNIGVRRTNLYVSYVWVDSKNNIALDLDCVQIMPADDTQRHLGHRYVLANASAVSNSIAFMEEAGRVSPDNRVNINPSIDISVNQPDLKGNGWILYPADLRHDVRHSTVPEVMRKGEWDIYTVGQSHWYKIPYVVNEKQYNLRLMGVGLNMDERVYREWWSHPFRILFFPALILDVITFPVQMGSSGPGG